MKMIEMWLGAAMCGGALFAIAPADLPWYGPFCIGGLSAMVSSIWMRSGR